MFTRLNVHVYNIQHPKFYIKSQVYFYLVVLVPLHYKCILILLFPPMVNVGPLI